MERIFPSWARGLRRHLTRLRSTVAARSRDENGEGITEQAAAASLPIRRLAQTATGALNANLAMISNYVPRPGREEAPLLKRAGPPFQVRGDTKSSRTGTFRRDRLAVPLLPKSVLRSSTARTRSGRQRWSGSVRGCQTHSRKGSREGSPFFETVALDQSVAWKLFSTRTDRATALHRYPGIRVQGEAAYGEPLLEIVSSLV